MYLVLGSSADESARWACDGLRARGVEPLLWVSADDLARAPRWEHRVGEDGASVEVTLADGRTLHSVDVRGVLNRLFAPPPPRGAHPDDVEYAGQEVAAFYLSWLHALPAPMLGRPAPFALAGAWRQPSEWTLLAARAGLPTAEHRWSGEVDRTGDGASVASIECDGGAAWTIFVAGREVVDGDGEVPREMADGCRRLAELSGATLLAVTFRAGDDGAWVFDTATPFPDLTRGGDALLDALARALGDGNGGVRA